VFAKRGYQKIALLHGTLTNEVEIILSVPSLGAPEAHKRSGDPQLLGHACPRLPGCNAKATLGV
jgi:hypothetical protein